MSDIIKYGEHRVLEYNKLHPQHLSILTTVEDIVKNGYVLFLGQLQDLSEEFHRKYESLYNKYHWGLLINQLKLSNKFYEEFFNKFSTFHKAELIKNKRVSEEFLRNHPKDFDQEVWKLVYSNV